MAEKHGKVAKPGFKIRMTCGNLLCLNPAHMQVSSFSVISKIAAKNGAYDGIQRRIKLSMIARPRGKLDMEKARAIRLSDKNNQQLAQEYGVNASTIQKVRANKTYVDWTLAGIM